MAEGIYAPDGSQNVTIKGGTVSVDTTGLASDTKQDTIITSVQLIDDVVFTEDAASTGGTDKGIAVFGVRQDTLASSVGTDGDYGNIKFDNLGRMWVTGTWLEDAAHSTGAAGQFVLTVRNDAASALASTDGDYAPFTTDKGNRLHVRESLDEYETVAASQTAQVLGATGGTGDIIAGILVIPATTSPGNVLLLDNATSITVFTGGASSVLTLHPFYIPLGMRSVSGAWKITTGANVSCIGIGDFT
jgi:hypothetical protein